MTAYKVGKSVSVDARLIAEADELEIDLINEEFARVIRKVIETRKAQIQGLKP